MTAPLPAGPLVVGDRRARRRAWPPPGSTRGRCRSPAARSVLWWHDGGAWLLAGVLLELPEPIVRDRAARALDVTACSHGGVAARPSVRRNASRHPGAARAGRTGGGRAAGATVRAGPLVVQLTRTVTDRTGATSSTASPAAAQRSACRARSTRRSEHVDQEGATHGPSPSWAMSGQAIDGRGDTHLAAGEPPADRHQPAARAADLPIVVIGTITLGRIAKCASPAATCTWVDSRGTMLTPPFTVTAGQPGDRLPAAPARRCWAPRSRAARWRSRSRTGCRAADRWAGPVRTGSVGPARAPVRDRRRAGPRTGRSHRIAAGARTVLGRGRW